MFCFAFLQAMDSVRSGEAANLFHCPSAILGRFPTAGHIRVLLHALVLLRKATIVLLANITAALIGCRIMTVTFTMNGQTSNPSSMLDTPLVLMLMLTC